MLTIRRRFTLGVHESQVETIKEKLKEFEISIDRPRYHGTTICDKVLGKFYFDCFCDEERMKKLINYLETDFKSRASIIF